jgi:hypothetical protein
MTTHNWFRPCNFGDCAEVMETDDGVWVRSSRNPEAVAAFTVAEWQQFVTDVRAGRFDDVAPAAGGDDDDELERLRAAVAMYRDWCARLPAYEHECVCGRRFSLRSTPALAHELAELERLRGIEQRAREYVEAVDRGRQLGVANLGRPILQFQPLRAALGIGPFLGDDDDQ